MSYQVWRQDASTEQLSDGLFEAINLAADDDSLLQHWLRLLIIVEVARPGAGAWWVMTAAPTMTRWQHWGHCQELLLLWRQDTKQWCEWIMMTSILFQPFIESGQLKMIHHQSEKQVSVNEVFHCKNWSEWVWLLMIVMINARLLGTMNMKCCDYTRTQPVLIKTTHSLQRIQMLILHHVTKARRTCLQMMAAFLCVSSRVELLLRLELKVSGSISLILFLC